MSTEPSTPHAASGPRLLALGLARCWRSPVLAQGGGGGAGGGAAGGAASGAAGGTSGGATSGTGAAGSTAGTGRGGAAPSGTAAAPGATQPGAAQPGVAQPGAVQPGTAQPSAAQPGAAQPGAAQPGTAQPSAAQPSAVQPGAVQPGTAQPGTAQPGAAQPGATAIAPGGPRLPAVPPVAARPTPARARPLRAPPANQGKRSRAKRSRVGSSLAKRLRGARPRAPGSSSSCAPPASPPRRSGSASNCATSTRCPARSRPPIRCRRPEWKAAAATRRAEAGNEGNGSASDPGAVRVEPRHGERSGGAAARVASRATLAQGGRPRNGNAHAPRPPPAVRAPLCLLALPTAPGAQDWAPDRPVRTPPFPPGGATDLVARILAERASRDLPHKWVVENRSGANGNIGMEAAAKSRPDGYTLGACTIGNCAINASVYARMPYDIERDLVPVFWSASVITCWPSTPPCRRARCASSWTGPPPTRAG